MVIFEVASERKIVKMRGILAAHNVCIVQCSECGKIYSSIVPGGGGGGGSNNNNNNNNNNMFYVYSY